MSLLPSFMATEIKEQTPAAQVLAIPREYGIDFETGQLTGEIVEGIEAVKVWIWCCVNSRGHRGGQSMDMVLRQDPALPLCHLFVAVRNGVRAVHGPGADRRIS